MNRIGIMLINKLIKCELWERVPSFAFDPVKNQDPRGNIIINIEGGKIILNFMSPEGEKLMMFKGKNAFELIKRIGHFDILSRSEHLLDVGAEIALKNELPYNQDKPLQI